MNINDSILVLYSKIWLEDYDELMQIFLPNFSTEFQARIYSYRRKEDRLLTLTGRKLLSRGLQLLNVKANIFDLDYNCWGMPFLKGNLIKFNISHSHQIAICALCIQGEVGIDIEHLEDIQIENFRNTYSISEWNIIQNSPDMREAFYRYWTQKEAVLKALGKGFNIPINSVKLQDRKARVCSKNYHLIEIKICPNYSCHLALSTLPFFGLNIYEIKNADIKNVGAQLLKK
ncbi:hypothetical protein A3860_17835 [Niastella vici]|uniref:4'-phosphopantetheinyl transferase domain-containing protein n=1 Tax=Niastella vici TaxID=1703345 RepID=A0A1V9G4X9_9BACT|nr:4'-phosphopantetheinyl transferase superfamily protein [Niastella vici]OQP65526.1 hypothetical protein A3860_17835 [Niastella vici]